MELQDKNTRIVLVSPDTEIIQCVSASKKNIKKGESVRVMGAASDTGAITARMIQTGKFSNFQNRMQ